MLRIKISFSSLLILIILILNGCNNEINQVEIDEDNTNISIENIETGSDFTLDDIKEFILFADTLADKITVQYTLSNKIIGKYDGIDVGEIKGEYDTFTKVRELIGDYYTDEIIDLEIRQRYLVNLYGKIGRIHASGENLYNISEESKISLLVDENNKKVIEMETFNDFGDIGKVEYTLEKQKSGNWIITDKRDYQYDNVNEVKKQLYYDVFSLMTSSQLNGYPPINAVDDNVNTAWVEGAEGDGIGEWLEFEAAGIHEVSGIKLINGYAKSEDLYYANNRIKKLRIELPGVTTIEKSLEDGIFLG